MPGPHIEMKLMQTFSDVGGGGATFGTATTGKVTNNGGSAGTRLPTCMIGLGRLMSGS